MQSQFKQAWCLSAMIVVATAGSVTVMGQVQVDDTLERTADATDPATAGIGRQIDDLKVTSVQRSTTSLRKLAENRAGLVIVMTSTGCPISRRYAARAAALERAFENKVAFLYVNAVDAETPDEMREAIKAFALRAPYVADLDGSARRILRPVTTTEVFLLDKNLKLVYRGALDDQYHIGGAAAEPKRHYLRDAIEALHSGAALRIRATKAPGCLVDMPAQLGQTAPVAADVESIEYYPRVAEVIRRNCMACHRRGGAAPFSLEFPEAVKGRATMIQAVVREGLMPPGHHLRDGRSVEMLESDRTMSPMDKDLLTSWLRSARLTGENSAIRPQLTPPNSWEIGPPDLILTTPGISLPADGPMQYVRQLLPFNQTEDRWVESIECRPVMPESLDIAWVWMIPPGGTVPLPGVIPPGPVLLASYSPGDSVRRLGPNMARRLVAGALLVVDAYSRPMGRATTSQLRVAMRFRHDPPAQELQSVVLCSSPFEVATGATGAVVETALTLDADVRIAALQPLMRGRGRELTVEATPPDGSGARELLSLGAYDWRWQIRYALREPPLLTKGTRITVRAIFDNSAKNPANPDATRPARSGPGAADEALILSMETLTP